MNYLELCKRVRQEAGVAGSGPATVSSQTGQMQRIVSWVAQAWEDIQLMRPNWLFMNADFSFDTAAGTRDYAPADYSITDLKLWDKNSFLIYEKSVGASDQNELPFLSYSQWRAQYRSQMTVRENDRPTLFTLLPNNSVRFEACPDKIYTVDGEYKRSTQTLAANDDEPTGLPDDFHLIIVWQALKYYGFHEDAPEVLDEAEVNFDNLLIRLEHEQLPEFSMNVEALA